MRPVPHAVRALATLAAAPVVLGLAAVPETAAHASDTPPASAGYRQRVLQLPPHAVSASPRSVNVLGRVVGQVVLDDGRSLAASWDTRGAVTVLPDLGGGAIALGQDDRDRIVGASAGPDGVWRAALWLGGRVRAVGPTDATPSLAWIVNRSGQVLGTAERDGVTTPILWRSGTGWRYLVPRPADGSRPAPAKVGDLDDSGTVVGTMSWPMPGGGPDRTAFRWTPTGGLRDLLVRSRSRGYRWWDATAALSESGVAAATALRDDEAVRATYTMTMRADGSGGLPLLVALGSSAVVNDRGWVVTSETAPRPGCSAAEVPYGFAEDATALNLLDLPAVAGACGELPQAVNDQLEVAGVLDPVDGEGRPYLWDQRRGARVVDVGDRVGSVVALTQAGHLLLSLHPRRSDQVEVSVWDPPEGVVRVVAPDVADTTVRRSAPTQAFGAQPWVAGGGEDVGMIRFAVPAAPAGRTLVAASVQFTTTTSADAGAAAPLQVQRITGAWSGSTTWQTRPGIGSRRLGVLGSVAPGGPVSVRIDPAEIPVHGGSIDLAVVPASSGTSTDGVLLASREVTDATLRPRLDLVYR